MYGLPHESPGTKRQIPVWSLTLRNSKQSSGTRFSIVDSLWKIPCHIETVPFRPRHGFYSTGFLSGKKTGVWEASTRQAKQCPSKCARTLLVFAAWWIWLNVYQFLLPVKIWISGFSGVFEFNICPYLSAQFCNTDRDSQPDDTPEQGILQPARQCKCREWQKQFCQLVFRTPGPLDHQIQPKAAVGNIYPKKNEETKSFLHLLMPGPSAQEQVGSNKNDTWSSTVIVVIVKVQ